MNREQLKKAIIDVLESWDRRFDRASTIAECILGDMEAHIDADRVGVKRGGERCPKCGNYAVYGKLGERVCTTCGAFEVAAGLK